jgi:two-component system chemotaxis sensor kinase CheA
MCFTLTVPLTLTTVRALLVTAGGETFALLGTAVEKLVRVTREELCSVEGREMLRLGETPVPVASLAATLGLPARERAGESGKAAAVVLADGAHRAAFVVDELLAEQEVLVQGLGARLLRVGNIAGAMVLPNGRVALILNASEVIRSALRRAPAERLAASSEEEARAARKRVLVVEDSVTTRTLERSILEAAGYEVAVAVDGVEAWQVLQERGTDVVVADVEMPRLDGFALTEAIRGSKRFRDLPVILLTALETERDKARGLAVGADAYLVKSAFDQKNLIETITQLL